MMVSVFCYCRFSLGCSEFRLQSTVLQVQESASPAEFFLSSHQKKFPLLHLVSWKFPEQLDRRLAMGSTSNPGENVQQPANGVSFKKMCCLRTLTWNSSKLNNQLDIEKNREEISQNLTRKEVGQHSQTEQSLQKEVGHLQVFWGYSMVVVQMPPLPLKLLQDPLVIGESRDDRMPRL
ncbi:uncharacterized protein LOC120354827 isoform X2 [Nilaparvata lugens]|uniref:uncharacterized protein LOC120354827 isoform X2 n=1 Tax=Nilaparvata lugens TaxID=108931 RepID=UPI00193E280D|nr:uncharacterized protein LOC120354827 isoform X2 [Nilaparvata lugens]